MASENTTPFSVLMSVYRNDDPENFRLAVESISIRQSRRPQEIIIVIDGPIPTPLETELTDLASEIPEIRTVFLKENRGLGIALRAGMEKVSNDIVARMDSDDIATQDRFEKQISMLANNPELDMVGAQITEFIGHPSNIVGKRVVPESNSEIYNWIKKRCPFNHMTVAFRKAKVLEAGNYLDWHFNEDYYLWIRMAEKGMDFANLPESLVNVRVGKEMYGSRGGWKYFLSEKGLQDYMLRKRIISFPRWLVNVGIRFGVQVMMPNSLRAFVFKQLFRRKNK
ncbi:MAG: glycosyltransferase [Muribaculaceae bacterium]|nr:glycosyltransferase [Muribaculaceae bacterium]